MSINDEISTMTKSQAAYVVAAAKTRIEELEKEKVETFNKFIKAYEGREVINLCGEDVYVNQWETRAGPFGNYEDTVFSFSNGSKIVINSF